MADQPMNMGLQESYSFIKEDTKFCTIDRQHLPFYDDREVIFLKYVACWEICASEISLPFLINNFEVK